MSFSIALQDMVFWIFFFLFALYNHNFCCKKHFSLWSVPLAENKLDFHCLMQSVIDMKGKAFFKIWFLSVFYSFRFKKYSLGLNTFWSIRTSKLQLLIPGELWFPCSDSCMVPALLPCRAKPLKAQSASVAAPGSVCELGLAFPKARTTLFSPVVKDVKVDGRAWVEFYKPRLIS